MQAETGEEVEIDEEEMDEESVLFYLNSSWDCTNTHCKAAAKHAAFVRARGRHYSNEAEAMKVFCANILVFIIGSLVIFQRAAKLMDDEDDETADSENTPSDDEPFKVNGKARRG